MSAHTNCFVSINIQQALKNVNRMASLHFPWKFSVWGMKYGVCIGYSSFQSAIADDFFLLGILLQMTVTLTLPPALRRSPTQGPTLSAHSFCQNTANISMNFHGMA